eukprot:12880270-Prorocentrum_lima.AAC.1
MQKCLPPDELGHALLSSSAEAIDKVGGRGVQEDRRARSLALRLADSPVLLRAPRGRERRVL